MKERAGSSRLDRRARPLAAGRGLGAAMLCTFALGAIACGPPATRRFPLRAVMWQDSDLRAVSARCHVEASEKDPRHVSCAPALYVSPLAWDGVDNSIFRPLSEAFAFASHGEAPNVNSLDEVPDSAWFTNRIGRRAMSLDELVRGACSPSQLLDASEDATAGSWVIDKGKDNGSSPGFRVRIPGKGKYMLKSDGGSKERSSGASAIGAAVYSLVGYFSSCEQVVYVKPSAFKLTPGLTITGNDDVTHPFDEAALEGILEKATHRGEYVRMQASAWLPGRLIGPFRYEKTREDDPNDIIAHEDRRDLRGARLLAAWLDHFDAREQNSMDSWIAQNEKGEPDASPGVVRHFYLDTSDILGSEWAWDGISRRLGHSYLLDWGYIGEDFVTLGIPTRPWDEAARVPGMEMFGYYTARNFVPETWVNEYPNPAFSRMTEHDGAWMARILARVTPAMVHALVQVGRFSAPAHAVYLETVLDARLAAILARYLTRLSPIADLRVDGGRLCGTDLARLRGVGRAADYHYAAELRVEGGPARSLPATAGSGGEVCVDVPRDARGDGSAGAPGRYLIVRIANGIARGPLDAHLYDLGPAIDLQLAGLERPAE
jgi:hypothetical protein